jgi:uncharacterized membrane protein YfcA
MMTGVILLTVSFFAGGLGAILGLGGGVVLIPALTLGYGINIRYAVGASIVSVIATSSGAAASYVRDRLTNIRLAIFLEVATTLGALLGFFIASSIQSQALYFLFGAVLLQSAYLMARRNDGDSSSKNQEHPWSRRMKLGSQFYDPRLKENFSYTVARVPFGFFVMLAAGILSGLLGIGSGILKVLALDRAMGLPIKASSATSNFMMGVTAAASAGGYYYKGDIVPELAAPVAIGVLIGSICGARVMAHLPARRIRKLFVLVLMVVSVQMFIKGFSYG